MDAHLQVDFRLKIGGTNETVSVTAEGNRVNTSSAELGTVIASRPIQELPVNGRSVLALRYNQFGGGANGSFYSKIQPFLGRRYDNDPNQAGILEDTFIISPTWLNEARLSVLRTDFTFITSSFNQNWPSKLGMPNVPEDTFPRMSNGFSTSSTSAVGERAATNPVFSDIMTLVRGKHSLRFGMEWRINRTYNKQTAEPSGVYTFNATVTGNPQSTAGTGYAFASYMLGAVASANVDTVKDQSQANFSLSGFVQDAWKVTERLTLNLGARYDFQQYPYDQNNGWSNFDINATDPLGLKAPWFTPVLMGNRAAHAPVIRQTLRRVLALRGTYWATVRCPFAVAMEFSIQQSSNPISLGAQPALPQQ